MNLGEPNVAPMGARVGAQKNSPISLYGGVDIRVSQGNELSASPARVGGQSRYHLILALSEQVWHAFLKAHKNTHPWMICGAGLLR